MAETPHGSTQEAKRTETPRRRTDRPLAPPIPNHHDCEAGPLELVLKAPAAFADQVRRDAFSPRRSLALLAAAVAFHAVYGLAMGCYGGGGALWSATIKAPLILIATLGLCSPSLYVLLGLGGCGVTARQTFALLGGLACLSSLLLLGFAPVAWLFGVSTSSLTFMVLLHVFTCSVAIGYGLRLLARSIPGSRAWAFGLTLWAPLFLIVGAQMTTYFRPILTPPVQAFRETEKLFFFQHFVETMRAEADRPAPTNPGHVSPGGPGLAAASDRAAE